MLRIPVLCLLVMCCALVAAPVAIGQSDEMPEGLAASDWSGIKAAYEAGRHAAQPVEGGYRARNPGQQWSTRFDGRGFTTTPDAGTWTWGLELLRYGFAGSEQTLTSPERVSAEGQRVAYDWDELLTEWYVNDTRGLEHGYTVHQRPVDDAEGGEEGPLSFFLAVRGELRPQVAGDGRGARFVAGDRGAALTYSGLTVLDADGESLAARLESVSDGLLLTVDERGARYPLTIDPIVQQAYLKASNAEGWDYFGRSVSVSGDTVVVGAYGEDSSSAGVNGDQSDNSASFAGAAYVFVRSGTIWSQQAYLKASNPDAGDLFGISVSVSGDTVVVGARAEASNANSVNGDQSDNSASFAGAAYVFERTGSTWSQEAYLKASNTDASDYFGGSVSASGDTVVVGAKSEGSNAAGVNGDQSDNSAPLAGAAYIFVRSGMIWSQEAYLKASNTDAYDQFGDSVSLSGDTTVVGATGENSNATVVDGDQSDNTAVSAGAAYVFVRNGAAWSQEAYLKASNTDADDQFGGSVSVSGDTAVVGALSEDSNATGVNGDQSDNSASYSGAAYVFVRNRTIWSQDAYLKASNTDVHDYFGNSVSSSGDTVVVGAMGEDSNATGVNGDQSDNSLSGTGAVYVFVRNGTIWSQKAYLKASNTGVWDEFGKSVSMSGDTMVVGAMWEDSNATVVNGDQSDNSASNSGAAYVFDIKLDAWQDELHALAGTHGNPVLTGTGLLVGGSLVTLTLTNALAGADATLIIGLSNQSIPFKGGVLVPTLDTVIPNLVVDTNGSLVLSGRWPPGVPSGFSMFFQYWIVDPVGPEGFAASNAISSTTP